MKTPVMLFLLLPFTMSVALGSTPSAKLIQDSQTNPILLYQCYRNGTTDEPENSVNYTFLLDGTKPNDDGAIGSGWFAINGTRDNVTQATSTATYDSQNDIVLLNVAGMTLEIKVLQYPYKGTAYYVYENLNGKMANKIYDTDISCANAKALLPMVCPRRNRCNMYAVRVIGNDDSFTCSFLPFLCA